MCLHAIGDLVSYRVPYFISHIPLATKWQQIEGLVLLNRKYVPAWVYSEYSCMDYKDIMITLSIIPHTIPAIESTLDSSQCCMLLYSMLLKTSDSVYIKYNDLLDTRTIGRKLQGTF